jgi:hypothetical protein
MSGKLCFVFQYCDGNDDPAVALQFSSLAAARHYLRVSKTITGNMTVRGGATQGRLEFYRSDSPNAAIIERLESDPAIVAKLLSRTHEVFNVA